MARRAVLLDLDAVLAEALAGRSGSGRSGFGA